MGKILINNIMFYGFHGVYEYEREQGQKFFFDVEMRTDSAKAEESDSMKDAVDYVSIYETVKKITENTRFRLLEALGGHICSEILKEYPSLVTQVTVRIRKSSIPIAGPIDYVQVEVTRDQK